MFKCKVCQEKDTRIEELKEQVAFLRTLISPSNSQDNIPIVQLEADGILSGQQHVINISDADDRFRQAEHERSERDRILSGTF